MGTVHRVDTDLRRSGLLALGIGAAFLAGGGALLAFTAEWFFGVLLAIMGVVAVSYAVRLIGSPTAGASVTVDDDAVTLQRGDATIRIPWADVDHWGVASRRAVGANSRFTRLVVWPTDAPAPATVEAAEALWSRHHEGWTVTTFDASAELLADLADKAPRPRRDAIEVPDW
ncbi:hypothetical protein [Actinopolymorpha alba]|uniref:hypothetical protein n=1 Tax=Actinopolymorpha alba TaxID=533267 RepID=UPI0003655700|nr:hypothetical protein [Actinopolymorpha alba]